VLDNGAVIFPRLSSEMTCASSGSTALTAEESWQYRDGTEIASVCVTAHRLEKVAETMLRALPLRNCLLCHRNKGDGSPG